LSRLLRELKKLTSNRLFFYDIDKREKGEGLINYLQLEKRYIRQVKKFFVFLNNIAIEREREKKIVRT